MATGRRGISRESCWALRSGGAYQAAKIMATRQHEKRAASMAAKSAAAKSSGNIESKSGNEISAAHGLAGVARILPSVFGNAARGGSYKPGINLN